MLWTYSVVHSLNENFLVKHFRKTFTQNIYINAIYHIPLYMYVMYIKYFTYAYLYALN